MRKNISNQIKIVFSSLILLILSLMNYYNLKDKLFTKIERFNVQINNKLFVNDLKNYDLKKNLIDQFTDNIKLDKYNSFYIQVNWDETTSDDELNKIKKIIFKFYQNLYKEKKVNVQENFLALDHLVQNEKYSIKKKLNRGLIEDTAYLKEANLNYFTTRVQLIDSYLKHKNTLDKVEVIEKSDETLIILDKLFEKKEYLILFTLIFNQLIIFFITFLFYKSIPRKF
jgi:hypothetical protein